MGILKTYSTSSTSSTKKSVSFKLSPDKVFKPHVTKISNNETQQSNSLNFQKKLHISSNNKHHPNSLTNIHRPISPTNIHRPISPTNIHRPISPPIRQSYQYRQQIDEEALNHRQTSWKKFQKVVNV